MQYIYGELMLNMVSILTTFKMLILIHNSIYLIPVLLEKAFAFGMIVAMLYIKKKYEYTDEDDWHSVESEYTEDDDWRSVESIELST